MNEEEKDLLFRYALGDDSLIDEILPLLKRKECKEFLEETSVEFDNLGLYDTQMDDEMWDSISSSLRKEKWEKIGLRALSSVAIAIIGIIFAISTFSATAETFQMESEFAQFEIELDGDTGYISSLEPVGLADDETLQLWSVSDAGVISLGVLGQNPQQVGFSTVNSDSIVVTVEAEGGVVQSEQAVFASLDLP